MKTAIFPGTFKPFTIGHKDILDQALKIFDKIYICYGQNSSKKLTGEMTVFIEEQRKRLEQTYGDKIEIYIYDTLLVDICEKLNCWVIIRGSRNTIDFEYEKNLCYINKELNDKITTVMLFPSKPSYEIVSSSFVRELHHHNRNINNYVF